MSRRRRWLAAGAALPALAWAGALRAQSRPPAMVGWLRAGSPESDRIAQDLFIDGMAALGWKLGSQYMIEGRWGDGRVERLPVLAQELALKNPAVIVAATATAATAAANAAPTTPIVLISGDPFSTGMVASLARPGGMVTGLSVVSGELNQKVAELLVETLPELRRVGYLADPTIRSHAANVIDVRRVAERFRFEAFIAEMAGPEEIEPAMARLAKGNVQAVVILANAWMHPHQPRILQLALAQRWPVVGVRSTIPRQGGLFNYGPDESALDRRVASYVDRILKGARPAELPIEQPTEFELVINLRTARQLGIAMPPSMMIRATEVIE